MYQIVTFLPQRGKFGGYGVNGFVLMVLPNDQVPEQEMQCATRLDDDETTAIYAFDPLETAVIYKAAVDAVDPRLRMAAAVLSLN